MDQCGESFDAPEVRYYLVAEPLHARDIAINATARQALYCEKDYCDNRENPFPRAMDVATLKRLMDERKDTQVGIARLLGITPDKMNKTLKGKRRLNLDEANVLRAYYGLDAEQSGGLVLLPIVGLVSAGAWKEGFESVHGYMPSPDRGLSRDSFVVVIEGDSMDQIAREGEGIIVDPRDLDLLPGRFYVIRNAEGETTFKRYMDEPARLEPCSNNPTHQTIFPGREMFTVIGRARKKVSDL